MRRAAIGAENTDGETSTGALVTPASRGATLPPPSDAASMDTEPGVDLRAQPQLAASTSSVAVAPTSRDMWRRPYQSGPLHAPSSFRKEVLGSPAARAAALRLPALARKISRAR